MNAVFTSFATSAKSELACQNQSLLEKCSDNATTTLSTATRRIVDITVTITVQLLVCIQLAGKMIGDHSKITLSTALPDGIALNVAVIITANQQQLRP